MKSQRRNFLEFCCPPNILARVTAHLPPRKGGSGLKGMPGRVRSSGTRPIHGNAFDTHQTCPAIAYPHKHSEICTDSQCSKEGQVCLPCGWGPNSTNLAACCGKDQLPQPDERGRYPCMRHYVSSSKGLSCKFDCCASGSVVCGDGCCKPGDHGYPHKCGRTLTTPRHGKGGKPCCVVAGASPSKQEESGCCIRGQGINCLKHETPCCLWVQGDEHRYNSDPHSPCQQSNCSLYQPCPHGEGYDCRFHGQSICCLRPGGSRAVSEVDPCQQQEADCQGRWKTCLHGVGSDCSKNMEACCLPVSNSSSNPCQADCKNYHVQSFLQSWWFWTVVASFIFISIAVFVVVCWLVRRRPARQVENSFQCKPPALVIDISEYEGGDFEPLPSARKDGEAVWNMLDRLGYSVIHCSNASLSEINHATQRLVTALKDIKVENPIIPIYYAGHGTEAAGTQFLIPKDAKRYSDQPISLDSLMECPAKAYLESGSSVKPLFFIVLDTCRFQPPNEEDRTSLGKQAAKVRKKAVVHKQRLKPEFVIIHACEPGGWAQPCNTSHHGLLTKAFLENGFHEIPLSDLLERMKKQVEEETTTEYGGQRQYVYVQIPQHTINASNLKDRYLGPSMGSTSRATSMSCIDLSNLSCGSSGSRCGRGEQSPSLMTSAMNASLLTTESDRNV